MTQEEELLVLERVNHKMSRYDDCGGLSTKLYGNLLQRWRQIYREVRSEIQSKEGIRPINTWSGYPPEKVRQFRKYSKEGKK